jgi:hypothetical protein
MKQKLVIVIILGMLVLSACSGGNAEDLTPTPDMNQIQTQAVETFVALQTQTALAQPPQLFPTLTPSPTLAPVVTLPATLPAVTQINNVPATKSCYSMSFVADVTIPDNTPVAPGQTFTKTWKVTNNGSCPWDAGFKFALSGGDAMSGLTYTLPAAVPVNGIVDISVAMTAPTNKTGSLRGNWRMQTAGGQFFGDEVFVIVVVGGATVTPTKGTATVTATATPTATGSYPNP